LPLAPGTGLLVRDLRERMQEQTPPMAQPSRPDRNACDPGDDNSNSLPLPRNSTRSVTVEGRALILVDRGGELYAYENNCPHANETLDPMGGSISSHDGLLLRCQRHAAEFLADTGECVSGPCLGESLTAVAVLAVGGDIYLD
jgi:nitrite reductase/ring-hydroxylating ferredoxin subunit